MLSNIAFYSLKNQKAFDIVNRKAVKYNNRFFVLVYNIQVPLESALNLTRKISNDLCKSLNIGFKISRKIGKAVQRNKLRRQLKHIIYETMMAFYTESINMIIVAKADIKLLTFQELSTEFAKAIIFCQKKSKTHSA